MTNPDCEVIDFDSAISEFDMSRVYTSLWKRFPSRVANWLLEKPNISGVGSHERNYDGKPSSVVVFRPPQNIFY